MFFPPSSQLLCSDAHVFSLQGEAERAASGEAEVGGEDHGSVQSPWAQHATSSQQGQVLYKHICICTSSLQFIHSLKVFTSRKIFWILLTECRVPNTFLNIKSKDFLRSVQTQFPLTQGPNTSPFETWIKVNYLHNIENFPNENWEALEALTDNTAFIFFFTSNSPTFKDSWEACEYDAATSIKLLCFFYSNVF